MKKFDTNQGLIGGNEKVEISIEDYDPSWPDCFEHHARLIRDALGNAVIELEHIGSTSITGLAAKPIIDILLVVEDSGDEDSYLPRLEALGYELRVREPDFHEHRMLRTPEKDVHIHVFSPDSPEIERYLIFRDQLRTNDSDRARYRRVKRELARQTWTNMNAYADAKEEVIEDIIARARRERE